MAYPRRRTRSPAGVRRLSWGSEVSFRNGVRRNFRAAKFHTAPAAQWVVSLEGSMSVTTSDNDTRRFRAGDVLRVEDVTPCKGHISVVGDENTFIMLVR